MIFWCAEKGQIEELESVAQSSGTSVGRDWTGGHLRFHVRVEQFAIGNVDLDARWKSCNAAMLTHCTCAQTSCGKACGSG